MIGRHDARIEDFPHPISDQAVFDHLDELDERSRVVVVEVSTRLRATHPVMGQPPLLDADAHQVLQRRRYSRLAMRLQFGNVDEHV